MLVLSTIFNMNALKLYNIAKYSIALLNNNTFYRVLPRHSYTNCWTSPETSYKFGGEWGYDLDQIPELFFLNIFLRSQSKDHSLEPTLSQLGYLHNQLPHIVALRISRRCLIILNTILYKTNTSGTQKLFRDHVLFTTHKAVMNKVH